MAAVSGEPGGSQVEASVPVPLTLYLVKRLELVIRALLDDILRPVGLTTGHYTAMSVLDGRGAMSSAQLARRSFLRPQTMHEVMQTLERRGLIIREPKPGNKRVLLATLTEHGRELLDECAPRVREVEGVLLDGLTPGQQAIFREGLQHGISALAELSQGTASRMI